MSVISFDAVLAARTSLDSPEVYASLILPNLTPEQVEAVAAEVSAARQGQAEAALRKMLITDADDTFVAAYLDALMTLAEVGPQVLPLKSSGTPDGWAGYAQRGVKVGGVSVKVTITPNK